MTDIAIKAENLSKAYRLGIKTERPETLVEAGISLIKAPLRNFRRLRNLDTFSTDRNADDILWALKDVSFEIARGEVVGFVGRNGAGKSTLLKILSRITEPTTGRIEIRGRVSSLLEVGTGFHPELSGRENVYMNGTILGMKKAEIDRKFDEIVEFSGVERFLDTPVKRYSSGMKVRLAFSVAAHLEPEILIVDEVLAVGDAEFQKKCLGKMQDVAGGGRTVLFVSHNMGAVQNLCSRALLLKQGSVVDEGPPDVVIRDYLSRLTARADAAPFSPTNPERKQSGPFRLTNGYLVDPFGKPTDSIVSGDDITLKLEYESDSDISDLTVTFTVTNEAGVAVTNVSTGLKGYGIRSTGRFGTISCAIPCNPFALGDYRISVAVNSHGRRADSIPGALHFSVIDSVFFGTSKVPKKEFCTVYLDHHWSIDVEPTPGEAVAAEPKLSTGAQ